MLFFLSYVFVLVVFLVLQSLKAIDKNVGIFVYVYILNMYSGPPKLFLVKLITRENQIMSLNFIILN